MSGVLLKIYSFLIVTTIFLSSVFLYTKNNPRTDTVREERELTTVNKEKELSLAIATTTENIVLKDSISTEQVTQQDQNNKISQAIDVTETDYRTASQKIDPCTETIFYTIGTFDPKFNISKNYFLKTISESASLWNNTLGRNVFEYTETTGNNILTINLVYDKRQQNTDNSKLLGAEIENTKNAADTLKEEYEALKVTFNQEKDDYTKRIETFNVEQKTYNETVASWNEKGGAPRNEYDILVAKKEQLQKESDTLSLEKEKLTSLLTIINTKISKYNELVLFANENVDKNNTTANKKFTEGNYNPNTNSITIYQFSDEIKLHRVITHELGHALGIGHTQAKQSIMNAMNTATTTLLHSEDIRELKKICP